jgi:hypothetical protein
VRTDADGRTRSANKPQTTAQAGAEQHERTSERTDGLAWLRTIATDQRSCTPRRVGGSASSVSVGAGGCR